MILYNVIDLIIKFVMLTVTQPEKSNKKNRKSIKIVIILLYKAVEEVLHC